jgi:hypothetical protein
VERFWPAVCWSLVFRVGAHLRLLLEQGSIQEALDEGNFRLEADPDLSAHRLYQRARSRMESRFRRIPGFLPTLSIIASSAADETSFTEKVIREIAESGDS